MKTRVPFAVAVAAAGRVCWLGYYFWKQAHTDPVTYTTEAPFVADIVKKTVATGSIVPRREVQIKPQVSGIVDELYVEAGQPVKEGQLLARIRTVANAASVNSAQNRHSGGAHRFGDQQSGPGPAAEVVRPESYCRAGVPQLFGRLPRQKASLEAAESNLQIAQRGARATPAARSTWCGPPSRACCSTFP
jgi:HlyD family secretion protein